MKLLTKAILRRLPALYASEAKGLDALAQVKFFFPDFSWTWYASEGSPVDENGYYDTDKEKVDFIFFGVVVGDVTELGYFSLSELKAARGKLGCSIERDRSFKPVSLRELMKLHLPF